MIDKHILRNSHLFFLMPKWKLYSFHVYCYLLMFLTHTVLSHNCHTHGPFRNSGKRFHGTCKCYRQLGFWYRRHWWNASKPHTFWHKALLFHCVMERELATRVQYELLIQTINSLQSSSWGCLRFVVLDFVRLCVIRSDYGWLVRLLSSFPRPFPKFHHL